MSLTSEAKQETLRLLRSGDRPAAVDYLSGAFNISSDEAGVLLEALEQEIKLQQGASAASPVAPEAGGAKMKLVIGQFLAQGRKLEAVKYVRHAMNLDLREALTTVDKVGKEINPQYAPTSIAGLTGCLRVVAKGLGAFLLLVSLLFLVAAGIVYYFQLKSIRQSDRVAGKVTEMKSLDSDATAPVIEYEWKGEQRLHESHTYSSPPDYEVGQTVSIFVNRENAGDVIIDTFADRYALIVGLGFIGGVLFLISIVFLYFGRRKF
jgi:ribosomal protein L7/L12